MTRKSVDKNMENNLPRNPLASLERNDFVGCPRAKENIFTDEECDRIILLSDDMSSDDGKVNTKTNKMTNTTVRDSLVKWLKPGSDTKWVFERIRHVANEANKFYKFELYGFNGIQVARYSAGGHYTWHMDLGTGENSLRKLSISVQLSSPDDYEGGELEFNTVEDKQLKSYKERGTAIFFPSFMDHRVAPVTNGTRWSLVTWVYGPPYR